MAAMNNVYDNLYTNLKNRFTVEADACEYTLGEYMLMKSKLQKSEGKDLSVVPVSRESRALATVVNYVNDKLTVKRAPDKDKTIRSFPFRASFAAFLSSALLCTVVFTYGLLTVKNMTTDQSAPTVVEADVVEDEIEQNSEN